MNRQEFEERLVALNTVLSEKGLHVDLYIAGGMAFILAGHIDRATQDADVFKTMNKEVEKILNHYDINTEIINVIKDNRI